MDETLDMDTPRPAAKLLTIASDLGEIKGVVQRMDKTLHGNGQPGLCQRQEEHGRILAAHGVMLEDHALQLQEVRTSKESWAAAFAAVIKPLVKSTGRAFLFGFGCCLVLTIYLFWVAASHGWPKLP